MTACILIFSEIICERPASQYMATGAHCHVLTGLANGIEVNFAAQGMASPFINSGIGASTVMASSTSWPDLLGQQRNWDGLHLSQA